MNPHQKNKVDIKVNTSIPNGRLFSHRWLA